jgi:signal transduction histidine kinase
VTLVRLRSAAVRRLVAFCEQTFVGARTELVCGPTLALAALGILLARHRLTTVVDVGSLMFLPVLAGGWVLRCRMLAVVLLTAVGAETVTVWLREATSAEAALRSCMLVIVAAASRLGAFGWEGRRATRQHEVSALLQASHAMGGSLDLASVGAEAVRAASGTVSRPELRGGRPGALVQVCRNRVVPVAACDAMGVGIDPGSEHELEQLPFLFDETLSTGRPTVATLGEVPPQLRALALRAGASAWGLARVNVAGEPFGILAVASPHPAEFRREDLRLLDGIARVAGLAVATALRHAELDELKRRLECSVDLALDAGRSLEPAEVVASTLTQMAKSAAADRATLARVEDHELVIESTYWSSGARQVATERHFSAECVEAIPALDRALATGQPVVEGRLEAGVYGRGLASALADGPRTLLFPLVIWGRMTYVVVLTRNDERPFDETDLGRLEPMADIALLALRNAHLHAQVEQAQEAASHSSSRLQHAIEAAEDIGSSPELSDVLERVLRRAIAVAHADRGSISRVDGSTMVVEHDHGLPGAEQMAGTRWLLASSAMASEAFRTQRAVRGTDSPDLRYAIACPLTVGREVVGLLWLSRRRDEFSEAELLVLRPFATLAGLLVRNAWLLEEARQVAATKSSFLNLAAHELRTPLAVVRGYLSMLEDGTFEVPQETHDEAIAILVAKARELEALVESLLTTARLEVGKVPRVPTEFPVADAVREAIERVGPRARLEGATLDVPLTAGGVVVLADRSHVERILDNLLNNALTYSPRPAFVTVHVRSSEAGEAVEIVVRDRGVGIPREQHARVFERFHRLDASAPSFSPGLGLGLSISRELAAINDGALVLEGSVPGQGSVFVLRLPAAAVPVPAAL